jgi:hypothetical protein
VAVLGHDELAQAAEPKLRELRQRAVGLLAKPPVAAVPARATAPASAPPGSWTQTAADGGSFAGEEEIEQALMRLRRALEGQRGAEQRLELRWTLFTRGEREGG